MFSQINIKIDNNLKEEVTKILNELGLTISDAVRIFLKKVSRQNGIPFDLQIDDPNCGYKPKVVKELLEAQKHREGLEVYDNAKDFFEDLGIKTK